MAATELRAAPFFIGDHLAMDFLNSTLRPAGAPIEWLMDGRDLVNWLEQAGAIGAEAANYFRTKSAKELDQVAKSARELREWLRHFIKRHAGRSLPPNALKELEGLNRLLKCNSVYFRIGSATDDKEKQGTQGLRLRLEHHWGAADQLLQPLALSIGELVCHADFRLVRGCENQACTAMFYDRTKSHRRRWCSMAACGNRAKVAAFRARQKQA